MATLTPEEIARIRRKTGAQDETDMPDSEIQFYFDQATTDAPSSDLVNAYTYVYILRDLWGLQRLKANRTTDFGDRQERIQVKDSSKELLDYWEGQAGLEGSGKLSTGTLDLDLDTECDATA